MEILAIRRLPHGRINVGGFKVEKRFIRTARPGTADLWCNIGPCGRCIWIEAKAAKGKQSPEQARFQQEVEAVGAVYLLVRSGEELERALKLLAEAPGLTSEHLRGAMRC